MFFFFNDTATTEIYTLPLHDALPISSPHLRLLQTDSRRVGELGIDRALCRRDRKSTRLNSSHSQISYAVFCLKKKKNTANNDMYEQAKHLHATHGHVDHCATKHSI